MQSPQMRPHKRFRSIVIYCNMGPRNTDIYCTMLCMLLPHDIISRVYMHCWCVSTTHRHLSTSNVQSDINHDRLHFLLVSLYCYVLLHINTHLKRRFPFLSGQVSLLGRFAVRKGVSKAPRFESLFAFRFRVLRNHFSGPIWVPCNAQNRFEAFS